MHRTMKAAGCRDGALSPFGGRQLQTTRLTPTQRRNYNGVDCWKDLPPGTDGLYNAD